ncbi:glyoxal oxidase [Eremomyces bilateralis CBS 781.70]|uniref:Glyoxal oxidase n=1 Tax=Eremomyces bilateralis CBS 781.70 TaxID=1392243 RepID=A0A6G1FW21_9PEZI|nr:glyoxal oxidase [Eremomyces bilateralis CBS 781.70]KAF1809892.1 glyoxal oxidase [Eremomyces bilateralis CBS 781.70]
MTVRVITLLIHFATANIIFPYVQPICDPTNLAYPGCLRGQVCLANGTCKLDDDPFYPQSFRRRADDLVNIVPPRSDGKCGQNAGGATCGPDPKGPFGPCCSQHGWCGKTDVHCAASQGCQAEFGVCASVTTSSIITSTKAAKPNSETARVSSGEPVIGIPTSSAPRQPQTTVITEDGSCGIQHDHTECGDWSNGACCSMYGFCGNTIAHCGDGCQSGPCLNEAVPKAPGPSPAPANANPGKFSLVGDSGVPAMHAGLLPNGKVVFLDKVENYTQMKLPNGQYAYSSEWDPVSKKVVPLGYKTNAFCAGGIFLADGTFVSLGGNFPLTDIDPTVGDGFKAIRHLRRSLTDASLDGQNWIEGANQMSTGRWYASAQTLPDGKIFVASGSLNGLDPTVFANNNPTYEILSRNGQPVGGSIPMELLVKAQPYYMYPFIHLLRDGSLFVFASKSSELFDSVTNRTIRQFTDLPGDYRSYPNTGSSVILPLSSANNWDPEVYVCGGGAYQDLTSPTDPSCGRIAPLSQNPEWEMDSMPQGRCMVEGVLLPDGSVAWLNGASKGAQGFLLAANPTLELLLMDPTKPLGQRWMTDAASEIPRLYHSVALLLLDGTILVAGSNPVEMPILKPTEQSPYVTEFRMEIYTPPYLRDDNATKRPSKLTLSKTTVSASSGTDSVTATFSVPKGANKAKVSLIYGGFVTHSVHMGQRMLWLDIEGWKAGNTEQKIVVKAPPSTSVAPPGPYMLFVVVDGIPSVGQFVMVN